MEGRETPRQFSPHIAAPHFFPDFFLSLSGLAFATPHNCHCLLSSLSRLSRRSWSADPDCLTITLCPSATLKFTPPSSAMHTQPALQGHTSEIPPYPHPPPSPPAHASSPTCRPSRPRRSLCCATTTPLSGAPPPRLQAQQAAQVSVWRPPPLNRPPPPGLRISRPHRSVRQQRQQPRRQLQPGLRRCQPHSALQPAPQRPERRRAAAVAAVAGQAGQGQRPRRGRLHSRELCG